MDFEIIQKGCGSVYVNNETLYKRYKTIGDVKYLKCTTNDCSSTAKIKDGRFYVLQNNCTHGSVIGTIQRLKITSQCRKVAAENDNQPMRTLFDNVCRHSDYGNAVSFGELENSMYKRRRTQLPALPASAAEAPTLIEQSHFASLNGEPFYRGAIEIGDHGRAIIFASTRQLDMLRTCTEISIDATFYVVPVQYKQLFTLFATVNGYTFPAIFILMTRKTTQLYISIYRKVAEIIPDFAPTRVMADYEESSTSSIRHVFGDTVVISGCWFHYAQSIIRKVRQIGLAIAFRDEENVTKAVRCLIALPLLPAEQILTGFQCITENSDWSAASQPMMQTLLRYVKRQWIEKATIGAQRLSVNGLAERTNNSVESFHARLKRRIRQAHPNLYVFLSHLRNVAIDDMRECDRLLRGMVIRRPKKLVYLCNDRRIKTCVSRLQLGTYTVYAFLKAISYNISTLLPTLTTDNYSAAETSDDDEALAPPINNVDIDTVMPDNDVTDNNQEPNNCRVCLMNPCSNRALVPCGHSTFCDTCIDTILTLDNEWRNLCPLCRAEIMMVIVVFRN